VGRRGSGNTGAPLILVVSRELRSSRRGGEICSSRTWGSGEIRSSGRGEAARSAHRGVWEAARSALAKRRDPLMPIEALGMRRDPLVGCWEAASGGAPAEAPPGWGRVRRSEGRGAAVGAREATGGRGGRPPEVAEVAGEEEYVRARVRNSHNSHMGARG